MTFTKQEKDGCARVSVEGAMSVYEAADLRDLFVSCFDQHDGLILDLSAVTECDTAGLQLLCAARVTADSEGKLFVTENMSGPVSDALRAAGLSADEISGRKEEV